MKKYFLLLIVAFNVFLVFSQKTTVKFDIKTANFKDTVFIGYQNIIKITGYADMSKYVMHTNEGTVSKKNEKSGDYMAIFPAPLANKTITLSIMHLTSKKIVFSKKIHVSYLNKEMIQRIPKTK